MAELAAQSRRRLEARSVELQLPFIEACVMKNALPLNLHGINQQKALASCFECASGSTVLFAGCTLPEADAEGKAFHALCSYKVYYNMWTLSALCIV
eukprot:19581-Heterococcus_DN1.PRE.3